MYFGHAILDSKECVKNLKPALKKGHEKGYTVRKIIFSHENNLLVGCLAIWFAENPLSTKVELGLRKGEKVRQGKNFVGLRLWLSKIIQNLKVAVHD